MMRLLILILVLSLPSQLLAERRVALVFGLDGYRTIRPLDNALADASAVADALRGLGFEVTKEEDRDLKRMRRALEDFVGDNAGADVAVIFYAGHGVEIAGVNRLLPVDADATSLERLVETSLPLEDLRASALKAAKVAVILVDACREDPLLPSGTVPGAGADRAGVRLNQPLPEAKPGFGRMGEARDTLYAFAAAPGAVAYDGKDGHSPFSTALVRYLGAPGLEIRSVLTLVQQAVYDVTRGRQLPYVENGLPQMFFANPGTVLLPERERLLLAMADLTPELRAEVEAVAAAADVPLAPLFGAVLAADLEGATPEDRHRELEAAARAYVETVARLRTLSSSDPEVTELRVKAEESLELGAIAEATAALDKAIALDIGSISALRGTLEDRILSAAASLWAKAGVALTALDTNGAIAALEEGMALFRTVEPGELTLKDWVLYEQTIGELARLKLITGDTEAARRLLEAYRDQSKARFERTGEPELLRSVSVALDRLGDLLAAQGDDAGALAAYAEGMQIAQRILDGTPDEPLYRRDLAISRIKLGDARMRRGDPAGAAAEFQQAVVLAAALAADWPDRADWQRDQVWAGPRVGAALRARPRSAEALGAYQAGLMLAQQLHARWPDDTEITRDLHLSWGKIADIAYAQQDFAEALTAARKAQAISGDLVTRDPANAQWLRDDVVNRMKIGDALAGTSDQQGAIVTYRAALDVQRRLVARDPANRNWRVDLALALNRLGDSLGLVQERAAAEAAHREAEAIYREVLATDPGNPGWRLMLAFSLLKVSFVTDDPKAALDEALALALALDAEGAIPPNQRRIIDFIRQVQGALGLK
jgi:uncharacterized caspase-like protein